LCEKPECRNCIGKHPRVNHWPDQATTDAETIKKRWRKWPDTNIGIATGAMSNIVVLDGVESTATLNKLQQDHEPVPPTFVQKSVSGRRHLVFRFPKDQGRLMKNEVKFAPGLDVRTTGGRLVVEASLHYSVSRYEWLTDLQDTPIADIPQWLLQIVIGASSHTETSSSTTGTNDESIPEGQRNDRLFKMGCALRRHRATKSSIEAALLQENIDRCTSPLSADEVRMIAESAATYDGSYSSPPDNPSSKDAAQKERQIANAQKKLTEIAKKAVSHGDSRDEAIPVMRAGNEKNRSNQCFVLTISRQSTKMS